MTPPHRSLWENDFKIYSSEATKPLKKVWLECSYRPLEIKDGPRTPILVLYKFLLIYTICTIHSQKVKLPLYLYLYIL